MNFESPEYKLKKLLEGISGTLPLRCAFSNKIASKVPIFRRVTGAGYDSFHSSGTTWLVVRGKGP